MFLIRPAVAADLPGILKLAAQAGVGLTTLPNDPARLERRIAASEESCGRAQPDRRRDSFLFVLANPESQEIAGTCGLVSAVGQHDAFYNYRVGTTVYASRELNVYNAIPTLYLSNDLTGASELGTLFLDPAQRGGGRGQLLSRCRYAFIALHRECFARRLIAELRGVADEQGRSPFWEGLGRHFFTMDFSTADSLSATEMRSFIAELMPKHPLDTVLLSAAAREVIGEVHPQTRPARRMLEDEGFRYRGYVDIFDAGPALEIETADVRSVRRAQSLAVRFGTVRADAPPVLMAAGRRADFRCLAAPCERHLDDILIDRDLAATLGVREGGQVLLLPPPSTRPSVSAD